MILQVRVEDAILLTTDRVLDTLREKLRADGIPYSEILRDQTGRTRILINGIPDEKSQAVQGLVSEQFPDWDLMRVPRNVKTRLLAMKTGSAANLRNQAFVQAMDVIRRRIDAFGVTGATITEYGRADQYMFVIQLPAVDDPTRVMDIIQSMAMLELKLVQDGPLSSREAALARHGGILPPNTELLRGPAGQNGGTWYIVNRAAIVTGRDLRPGGAQPSEDKNGRPQINLSFTRAGAARLERTTGQYVGAQVAIILDHAVVSTLRIESTIRDSVPIIRPFTPQQAADLALLLNSGALPATIMPLSIETR